MISKLCIGISQRDVCTYYIWLTCRNANEELKDAVSSDDEEEKLAVDSVKEEEEDTQSEYREGRQLLNPSLSSKIKLHVL